MNGAVKFLLSAGNRLQAVVPPPSGLSGPFQSNAAPPHAWTSIPRCVLYQAPRAFGSFDLKKMPPIPVTRFMASPVRGRARRSFPGNGRRYGAPPRASMRRPLADQRVVGAESRAGPAGAGREGEVQGPGLVLRVRG